MAEHTPTPWAADPDDREGYEWNIHIVTERDRDVRVAFMTSGPEAEPNAAFIVKAVNMHQELVDALKDCAFTLGAIDPAGWSNTILCERVRDLIAKASGQYAALDELRKPVDEVRE